MAAPRKAKRPFICDHATATWHRSSSGYYTLRCRVCAVALQGQRERPAAPVTSMTVLFKNDDGSNGYAPFNPKGWQ